jgi:transcriptional regulator of nitric oxide reductase/ferredoxin
VSLARVGHQGRNAFSITRRAISRRMVVAGGLLWAALCGFAPAQGAGAVPPDNVSPAISRGVLDRVFPGAERLGPFEGTPPAAVAYREGAPAGYVLSTAAVTGSVGFSGKPLDVLVGVDRDGIVTGAVLRHHSEPILVIGIPEARLGSFVAAFAGRDVRATRVTDDRPAPGMPDAIAGATVSSAVIADAILRSARTVARARGILGTAGAARLDRETFTELAWGDLVAMGAIVRRRVVRGEIDPASGASADDTFIDLHAGLATPPVVGQNLLGKRRYNELAGSMKVDDNAILIAASGLYSFKGTAYVRSGVFDRVQLVQDDGTIPLRREGYSNVESLDAGAPEFREAGLFVVPAESGFDPLRPWRIELRAERPGADAGDAKTIVLDYVLPERLRTGGDSANPDAAAGSDDGPLAVLLRGGADQLWLDIWRQRAVPIGLAVVLLAGLTGILLFQDTLASRRRAYVAIRYGFLAVTLLGLGWLAGAQLSVVNVLTFVHSLLTEFRWEFFLLDPLLFLLWSYVAVALLFWGRGVFCGWLCPFGALQELAAAIARRLRVPQIRVPFGLHERLWPVKYIAFLALFAVSLNSTDLAVVGAEIEPFKTAIVLGFDRAYPFVGYAAALLVIGLTIERFFCRYVCPLGGALAIPARGRMFEWLKRRFQCGRDCHICEANCPVQAIHPNGAINPNECIHCLKCQTLYFDDQTCPPLISRRKRRERLGASAVDLDAARQREGDPQ